MVTDQRSIDTRVVTYKDHDIMLRSQSPLEVGQQIMFAPRMVQAGVPSITWQEVQIPSFLSDEFQFDRRLAMKYFLAWGSVYPQRLLVM